MAELREGKISDLHQDPHNANRGTERGKQMLTESLSELGAGRSIVVDKNGAIIAGNKTAARAGELGMQDVIIVQTDGSQLVAVQRTDLEIGDPRAKKLAILDNRISEVDLAWDKDVLEQMSKVQPDVIASAWDSLELKNLLEGPDAPEKGKKKKSAGGEGDQEGAGDGEVFMGMPVRMRISIPRGCLAMIRGSQVLILENLQAPE